jgi:hypothetical protein
VTEVYYYLRLCDLTTSPSKNVPINAIKRYMFHSCKNAIIIEVYFLQVKIISHDGSTLIYIYSQADSTDEQ